MNARVRPAVFMPLFATSTVEGPTNHEHLIEQMKAAGMMAGAWMVEEAGQRRALLEELAGGLEIETLGEIKGTAHEISTGLSTLSGKLEGLAERLGTALTPDELEAERAGFLSDGAEALSSQAEELYDMIGA